MQCNSFHSTILFLFSQDSDAEINGKNVQQIELNSKHITIHQLSEEESNEERRTAR